MKIICIVPARYASSRLPGKPIMDICGKPMLWWVYNTVKNMEIFEDVYCAIDDERIQKVCEELNMRYVMTKNDHPNHISRIQEVSNMIDADYYFCINGDEPLISEKCILPVVPSGVSEIEYFGGAMRILTDPAEVIDPANIKLVVSNTGRCIYMSRIPVPFPKGTLDMSYRKYVGVECFNKKALDFFVETEMGEIEKIEDIDHLRFLENDIAIFFSLVESDSISVDTSKDLDFVRKKMQERLEEGSAIGD